MDNQIGFFRLPQVLELIPVSKSTWWAGVKNLKFPAPVKLGPRTTAWRKVDIIELAANLSAGLNTHDESKINH